MWFSIINHQTHGTHWSVICVLEAVYSYLYIHGIKQCNCSVQCIYPICIVIINLLVCCHGFITDVINTHAPLGADVSVLEQCYKESLSLALQHKVRTIVSKTCIHIHVNVWGVNITRSSTLVKYTWYDKFSINTGTHSAWLCNTTSEQL